MEDDPEANQEDSVGEPLLMKISGTDQRVAAVAFLLFAGLWLAEPAVALRDVDRQLMEAVQSTDAARVKALVAKGASVRAKDEAGNTALHYASTKEIAGMLIAAGAPVNARNDDFEMTPLFNVTAEAAAVLIAKGAVVNARARRGMTPLAWAVYWDQMDKAVLLLARGADVNARDDDGKTALHVAANWDKPGFVSLLIAAGADINARDNVCWTPLHWAAFEAEAGTMELLLAAGAERNVPSCRPDADSSTAATALDVAARYRSADIVAYLKSRGCRSAVP
jgi:ankyrin repeat protein